MTTTKAPRKRAPAKRSTKPPAAPAEVVTPEAKPEQLPLPGLEVVEGRVIPYLEVGVRRTIAALYLMGNVTEQHAAHTAAAVELAQIIDKKKSSGRMSTIGNDMRAMIELLDRIVPEKSEMDETLRTAMDEWSAAHAAAEPWATGGP